MSTPVPDAESDRLHARARAFATAFERGESAPEPFDALACDLARFQASRVQGFARVCRARGLDPASFTRASSIPALPTDCFKLARVCTFPGESAAVVFRTSGTTLGTRGEHAFRDLGSYHAGALAFGRANLLPDLPGRVPVLVIGPPPAEATDSSLTHMMSLFVQEFGVPATPEETYFLRDGILDVVALDERIARLLASGVEGALVLGTSFAFVHLLDALGGAPFRLPSKSRVMQTGGFKGRSREVDASVLRSELSAAFCVAQGSIVSEYGMTELSSQFYEGTLHGTPHGVHREPPWARVVPVDPETLEPLPDGVEGIARIEDLMNVDSAFAVLAQDRVRRVPGGFELLGRLPGAVPRGCSIAIDELLGFSPDVS